MDKTIFSNISKIIERGKKSSTYKYALLRGTIDIIQENSPYLSSKNDKSLHSSWIISRKMDIVLLSSLSIRGNYSAKYK